MHGTPGLRPARDPQWRSTESAFDGFLPKGVFASAEVISQLLKQPWLGNVRELRNFVHRAAALGTREAMAVSFDSDSPSGTLPVSSPAVEKGGVVGFGPETFEGDFKSFRERWVDLGEREYLARLLPQSNRNVVAAARIAGVSPTYVYRLIRKHLL